MPRWVANFVLARLLLKEWRGLVRQLERRHLTRFRATCQCGCIHLSCPMPHVGCSWLEGRHPDWSPSYSDPNKLAAALQHNAPNAAAPCWLLAGEAAPRLVRSPTLLQSHCSCLSTDAIATHWSAAAGWSGATPTGSLPTCTCCASTPIGWTTLSRLAKKQLGISVLSGADYVLVTGKCIAAVWTE